MHKPKLVLVVMDGWGYSPIKYGNAVIAAKTPTFDYLWNHYARTLLNSFGLNVGLPWGSIGSSEVGHTSIGSGQLINQELAIIDKAIADGDFYENEAILSLIKNVHKKNGSIHLAGLVSDGGVHSHMEHLFSLLAMLKKNDFKNNIFIHVFTDGRDTSPKSSIQYIQELEKKIRRIGIDARISTVIGRYFSMDRGKNWERTKKAYLAMTERKGVQSQNYLTAIQDNYSKEITDEFIPPIIMDVKSAKRGMFNLFRPKDINSDGAVKKGDGLIFFNIRPDRMRQITELFLLERKDTGTKPVSGLDLITFTTYDESLPAHVAFPSEKIKNPIAKILSDNNFKQGHFAESEKYAHVTYFFNGGNPKPFPGEIWRLVPSKKVATYDLKPEMSAKEITDEVFECLRKKRLDFVLINYANCDMVGHTGNFKKVVVAVETVDAQLKRLTEALLPESTIMITADHGNGECMIHPKTKEIDKKHTVNPVPFILVDKKYKRTHNKNETVVPSGILADITPTILGFFNLKKSSDMNGEDITSSLQ